MGGFGSGGFQISAIGCGVIVVGSGGDSDMMHGEVNYGSDIFI